MNKTKDLHIRITEEDYSFLKKIAAAQERTPSNTANIAIRQYIRKRMWGKRI